MSNCWGFSEARFSQVPPHSTFRRLRLSKGSLAPRGTVTLQIPDRLEIKISDQAARRTHILGPFLLSLSLIVPWTIVWPAHSQNGLVETQETHAYQQFRHGKAKEAIAQLQAIIAQPTNLADKVALQRNLLEMCDTAFDRQCVDQLLTSMFSEPLPAPLRAEVTIYRIKRLLQDGDYKSAETILQNGGPFAIAAPGSKFLILAELQIALHAKYIDQKKLQESFKPPASDPKP